MKSRYRINAAITAALAACLGIAVPALADSPPLDLEVAREARMYFSGPLHCPPMPDDHR